MNTALPTENLTGRLAELRRDLLDPGGPQISQIRAYRFAIFHYAPEAELAMRRGMKELSADLKHVGWNVVAVSGIEVFLERLRREARGRVDRLVASERAKFTRDPLDGLDYVRQWCEPWLESKDGIAADIAAAIEKRVVRGEEDRTVAFVGRLGAFYPFYRTSALLRFLDGRVSVPVILLYPGVRVGDRSLSFMGVHSAADSDYRPHIY